MRAASFDRGTATRIITGTNLIARRGQKTKYRGEIAIHSAGTSRDDPNRPRNVYTRGPTKSFVLGTAHVDHVMPVADITIVEDLGRPWRYDLDRVLIDQTAWDPLVRIDRAWVWLFVDPIEAAEPVAWLAGTGCLWQFPAERLCPTCHRFVKEDPYGHSDPLDPHTWEHLAADHRAAVADARTVL